MAEFAEIFAEALRRMAADERRQATRWRQHGRWFRTFAATQIGEQWAAEHDSRSRTYDEWAKALSFPGGPVDIDYVRYGTQRAHLG